MSGDVCVFGERRKGRGGKVLEELLRRHGSEPTMPTMWAGLDSSLPAAAKHSCTSITEVMVSASASLAGRPSRIPPMITESAKATPARCINSLLPGSPSMNSKVVPFILFSSGKSYVTKRVTPRKIAMMTQWLVKGLFGF